MSTEFTQFDYLLNSILEAGRQDEPAKHGYGEKRRALYAHVRELERLAAPPTALSSGSVDSQEACERSSGKDMLLSAARWLEMFFRRDGESANDQFERVAEVFHRETGYLRPGKDCRLHSPEEREEVWTAWVNKNLAEARAALGMEVAEPHLCIAPACGDSCSGCASALSPQQQRAYAIRYAFLREAPLDVVGVPCVAVPSSARSGDFANGIDADAAIDAAMKNQSPRPQSGTDGEVR